MAMYEGGAGTTAPYPHSYDQPNEPTPMLEQQLDDALTHIKTIDAQLNELNTARETYLQQAHEARAKLIDKLNSASCLLPTPKKPRHDY